uniref:1-acyl-sn-glycerol-3-phosphate acyltransferase n=1 Tax=Caligus clemensi TaxID=344056 RepID=C1C2L6_CALCM|nr:Probable 1-acyl-sn-glycerol-3-phosphate acyltransferase [Caligus clemensi]
MLSWILSFLCSLIFVIMLCFLSEKFAWFIKFVFVGWVLLITNMIIITFALLEPSNTDKAVRKAHSFINVMRGYILGLTIEVRGKEVLQASPEKSFVILCNHQSVLDMLVMGEVWNVVDTIRVAVKSEFKKYGLFSWAMQLCGAVFVDRKASSGRDTLNKAVQDLRDSNCSLFVFPEGTRHFSPKLEFLPFKKGAFHAAFDAGYPILPVVISHYDFLDEPYSFRTGKIVFKVLGPHLP